MPMDSNIARFALVALLTLVFGVLFLSKSGRQTLFIATGAMIALSGVVGLLIGTLPQQYGAAPPLRGTAATVGSICLVGAGLLVVYLSLRDKSAQTKEDAEPSAAPNDGPAKPPGNSDGSGAGRHR
jgi:hypothetical protein